MDRLQRLEAEIMGQLNPRQREAVLDESSTCVVNANVGSGKTTVLIAKLLYLSYIKNIRYSQMIVLTFTHKAAEEIRRRLEAWEGSLTAEQLAGFGTFHSVAYRLLKQALPIEELGYTREFQVLLPEQELELAQEIIQDRGYKIKYPARLKKRLEAAQRLGRQGRGSVEGKRLDKLQDDIWQLAESLEQEKRQRNVMTFRELLVYGERLLKKYPIHPAWIVIDEVQDSDEQQLAFLDALRGPGTRLFAVGDPNQIIYGWRGSSINACFTLVHRYGARELTLPMNYRSGSRILEAARYFKQYGDKLTGSRDCSGQVRIRQAYDPLGEAYYLAEQIRKLRSSGLPLGQIAIFYRLQAQAQPLADVFAREGIPCQIVTRREQDSGESYLEQEGIRIYGEDGEDGEGGSSESVRQEIILCQEEESEILSCREAADREPVLHPEEKALEHVWLMTLHASKGLEFSHVFIIGVNYGLIPLHPSGFEEEEEERRLFFVGMTRAKDYLELSYYTQPVLPKVVPGESRYLQMIPERLVEQVDDNAVTESVNGLRKTGSESEEGEKGTNNKELAGGESGDTVIGPATPRRVRHIKYGVGVVTGETEEKITVDFGELGSKSFMKDFVSLEPVTED